ncbi:CBS domain-containing protein [Nonomuraea sp. NPDC048901]|uniref:CBS domain-containing protein n=1 Tax=Nonomuraea sp. NPDC048901 TaxID=3155627 RepID=UPI0033DEF27D
MSIQVKDVMGRVAIAVLEEASFAEIVAAMKRFAVGAVTVIDADRRPVGVVRQGRQAARLTRDRGTGMADHLASAVRRSGVGRLRHPYRQAAHARFGGSWHRQAAASARGQSGGPGTQLLCHRRGGTAGGGGAGAGPATVVQPVGPLAYLLWGRRP